MPFQNPSGKGYPKSQLGSNPIVIIPDANAFKAAFKRLPLLADAGFDPLPTYLEPQKSPQGKRWQELGEKYPLILSAGQRDLFYTASQMHQVGWLRKHRPFAVAAMASRTAAKYNITDGQEVYVVTDRGQSRMHAKVDDRIAEGVIMVPHGWHGEGNCNLLTDCRTESRESIMGYPTWKSQLCTLRPVGKSTPWASHSFKDRYHLRNRCRNRDDGNMEHYPFFETVYRSQAADGNAGGIALLVNQLHCCSEYDYDNDYQTKTLPLPLYLKIACQAE